MATFTTATGRTVLYSDTHLQIRNPDNQLEFVFLYESRAYASSPSLMWHGLEQRRDELGRIWNRGIDRLVIDDFGSLVEVPL